MKPITYEQALHRLAAYCSRGERCIFDLRKKMEDWELPASEQSKVLQYLQKERFVDEQRFCKAFVNDKFRYNRWGTNKIRYELKKKRLPEEFIRAALADIDPQAVREQLRQLVAVKRKTVKGNSEYEINQKLLRFAAGRGFAYDDIVAVLIL